MKKKLSKELKILILTFIISIISMIGHNLFYALAIKFPNLAILFNILEATLFFTTLISALIFFITIIYTGIKYLTKGKPKDAWNIGWIGLALLIFFLVVGMNTYYFHIFAIILLLFFIPKIKQKIKK
jgi:hypothetical protein